MAAAWANADHQLADLMLAHKSSFGLVEVLKALTLLDAGRQIRAIEKKVKRLQVMNAKLSTKKLGKFKSDVDNLKAIKPCVSF